MVVIVVVVIVRKLLMKITVFVDDDDKPSIGNPALHSCRYRHCMSNLMVTTLAVNVKLGS